MSEAEARQVPDTLDLAGRMRMALNSVLGAMDPDADYTPVFLTFFLAQPPYMIHWSGMYSGVLPYFMESLPLLRSATGSTQGPEIEEGMLAAVFKNTSHDGLIYDEERPDRPWNSGIGYGVKSWKEDYACLAVNGRLIRAFHHYHQVTGDASWVDRMNRTARKMIELAIEKDDYAYYPNVGLGTDFSYPKHSGWVHTREPIGPQEGAEGATTFFMSQPLRGLMRYYRQTGDKRALELSRKMKNLVLDPRFWGGYEDLDKPLGGARAHFWGHYHGNTATLRALLEYAAIADDWTVKEFVRDGYEWARHHSVPRLGLFPEVWFRGSGRTETCALGDMIALAIQLSDEGVGDYWDDADHYVRNGLVEAQMVDEAEMERLVAAGPVRPPYSPWGAPTEWRFDIGLQPQSMPKQELTNDVLKRAFGGFSQVVGAHYQYPFQMHCCNGNAPQALYVVWEGIVRRRGMTTEVNLFLNRRSPWLDVESWLPYEGRVQLHVKVPGRVAVRIPSWISRSHLRWQLDGADAVPELTGRYAIFDGLRPGQTIDVGFALHTESVSLPNLQISGMNPKEEQREYHVQFRGTTAVSLAPLGENAAGSELPWYRTFRRSHFLEEAAPMVVADDYVAETVVDWQG